MPDSLPAFERAVIRVVHPQLLRARVGGMLMLERQLFTAARAGLKSIWVAIPEPAQLTGLRVPPALEMRWVFAGKAVNDEKTLFECEPPYLRISADHLLRVDTLAFVARQRFPTAVSYEDESGRNVILVILTHDDVASRDLGRVFKQPLPYGSYKRLDTKANGSVGRFSTAWGGGTSEPYGSVVDWLMVAGPKLQDGFMARHFDRHLSLAASRALLDSSLTPNQVTVLSTILGLIGSAFFLNSTRLFYVMGALLVWLHSVLDGCDGELARVRFQESQFGSDLDFWGDNFVHLALFSCIGLGFWRTNNDLHTVILAVVADAGVIASAWTMWKHRRTSAPESNLGRLENALAQRDFIYLLVLLAFVDYVYEFLWAAAVGGGLYLAIMLYIRRPIIKTSSRKPSFLLGA